MRPLERWKKFVVLNETYILKQNLDVLEIRAVLLFVLKKCDNETQLFASKLVRVFLSGKRE